MMLRFNMWLETLSSTAVATSVLVLSLQRATCYNRHFICFYLGKIRLSKQTPEQLEGTQGPMDPEVTVILHCPHFIDRKTEAHRGSRS